MAPLDERLLADAREAQAAELRAQGEVERARVRFVDAVRRLHAGGGSTLEIGQVFGLSYQRIDQIVNGDGRSAARCAFCGADSKAAHKLIAGPGVYVCDACVHVADRTMRGDAVSEQEWTEGREAKPLRRSGHDAGDERCSFCGKTAYQVDAIAAPDGCRICQECLDLCMDIIEEPG